MLSSIRVRAPLRYWWNGLSSGRHYSLRSQQSMWRQMVSLACMFVCLPHIIQMYTSIIVWMAQLCNHLHCDVCMEGGVMHLSHLSCHVAAVHIACVPFSQHVHVSPCRVMAVYAHNIPCLCTCYIHAIKKWWRWNDYAWNAMVMSLGT